MKNLTSQAVFVLAPLCLCLCTERPASGADKFDISVTSTGDKIIILPGLLGNSSHSSNPEFEINKVDQSRGGLKGLAHAQVWDWTRTVVIKGEPVFKLFSGLNPVALQQRLNANPATTDAARALALKLVGWQKKQHAEDKKRGRAKTRVYLLAGSAGTVLAKLVCDAKHKANEEKRILPKCFFERVVFVSGAIRRDASLANVNLCARDGVYNYFSPEDKVLTEGEGLVGTKVGGKLGYKNTEQFEFIHYQMEYGVSRRIDNDGSHLDLLEKDKDLRHYVLPLFQILNLNNLSDAWSKNTSWKSACPTQ